MSKKPAAALSASLVAVKGAAVPAPDMPSRGAPTGTCGRRGVATLDPTPASKGRGGNPRAAKFPGARQVPA